MANFSVAALQRLAGFLDADFDDESTDLPPGEDLFGEGPPAKRTPEAIARLKHQQNSHIQSMDSFLGGAWWRDLCQSGADWIDKTVRRWLLEIANAAPPWRGLAFPVADAWNGPTAYYLVLLTTNPIGLWEFNEAVSKAYERMHKATFDEQPSQGSLFEEDSVYVDPAPEWVDALVTHLRGELDKGIVGTCAENLERLYGPLLGRARTTHLRHALKRLHRDGVLQVDPTGKLEHYRPLRA